MTELAAYHVASRLVIKQAGPRDRHHHLSIIVITHSCLSFSLQPLRLLRIVCCTVLIM
jgi:hypothetical protein